MAGARSAGYRLLTSAEYRKAERFVIPAMSSGRITMNDRLMCDAELVQKVISDLEVKAAMFDMEVDIEALTIVPKSNYKEPIWITRWKEKEHGADHDNRFDYDQDSDF